MSDQEVTYSTLRFLQSPSESQNRLRPDGTQRPDKTEQKESSVPWHGIAVTLGILCLLLLMTITVLGIKIFQYIQEKHQQEESLRNLSQKYDVMQNDNYLKKQLLTKKTSECDRLNETFQQMKGSDLVFTEKKGCYHENESSESLPNTDMMEKRVYTEVKSLGKRKRMQSRTADTKYEGVMMRTDFVPLYFPENNGKKMEYMTVTLAAPDQRTGERPEISQKEAFRASSSGCIVAVILGIICVILLGISAFFATKYFQNSFNYQNMLDNDPQKYDQNMLDNDTQEYEKARTPVKNKCFSKDWLNSEKSREEYKNKWFCCEEKCYYFSNIDKTFEESRKFCTNQGSHLLKIEDEDEQSIE
ncbi:hypothetical protein MJG53_004114 [Ovis ammon polii x Ovis aries]|uniref:Uncharacterized protein n=1 Tax=Ovis ammon polii x Ovis aries TaxID=2918886 RepID=A0ACB9V9F3_9CETA|nr:hypothetical protein MJG53_004114 [Ovis ammon polii x Ovis aries]